MGNFQKKLTVDKNLLAIKMGNEIDNEVLLWELLEKNEPYPRNRTKTKVVEADCAACRAKEQGRAG